MCASYTFHPDEKLLQKALGAFRADPAAPFEKVDADIYPHKAAAVLVLENGEFVLTVKRYSLTPIWSKEEKVKWATYNARMNRNNSKTGELEMIYQVPTWKGAFGKHHCLVPLNHFRESCHSGKGAGHIVSFAPKEEGLLFAAGLCEDWVNKKTGEIVSTFAIITTDPDEFIQSVGHDRSPVFLSAEQGRRWLEKFSSPKEAYAFLEEAQDIPELDFQEVRPLKSFKAN